MFEIGSSSSVAFSELSSVASDGIILPVENPFNTPVVVLEMNLVEKAKLQQVVNELPQEVDLDALVERLYLLRKIEIAEQQISAGQGIPHEQVKQRLERWLK